MPLIGTHSVRKRAQCNYFKVNHSGRVLISTKNYHFNHPAEPDNIQVNKLYKNVIVIVTVKSQYNDKNVVR